MRRIVFWRPGSEEKVLGELRLEGKTATATGCANGPLRAARGRGDRDVDTFARYVDWSNGVFNSREVQA